MTSEVLIKDGKHCSDKHFLNNMTSVDVPPKDSAANKRVYKPIWVSLPGTGTEPSFEGMLLLWLTLT